MMSIVPVSATTSLMRYEVYRSKSVSAEEFKKEVDFFGQVEEEDKFLANGSQANFNSNTYRSGKTPWRRTIVFRSFWLPHHI